MRGGYRLGPMAVDRLVAPARHGRARHRSARRGSCGAVVDQGGTQAVLVGRRQGTCAGGRGGLGMSGGVRPRRWRSRRRCRRRGRPDRGSAAAKPWTPPGRTGRCVELHDGVADLGAVGVQQGDADRRRDDLVVADVARAPETRTCPGRSGEGLGATRPRTPARPGSPACRPWRRRRRRGDTAPRPRPGTASQPRSGRRTDWPDRPRPRRGSRRGAGGAAARPGRGRPWAVRAPGSRPRPAALPRSDSGSGATTGSLAAVSSSGSSVGMPCQTWAQDWQRTLRPAGGWRRRGRNSWWRRTGRSVSWSLTARPLAGPLLSDAMRSGPYEKTDASVAPSRRRIRAFARNRPPVGGQFRLCRIARRAAGR